MKIRKSKYKCMKINKYKNKIGKWKLFQILNKTFENDYWILLSYNKYGVEF